MTKHVAFLNIPALGHIYPTLPVVEELIRRGHRVTYPAVAQRAALVRATGATVVPYESSRPSDTDRHYQSARTIAEALLTFVVEAEKTFPQWEAALTADRPDLILFDRMAFAGGVLASKHGIPAVQLWPMLVAGPQWTWADPVDPDDPAWATYQVRVAKLLAEQGVSVDLLVPEVVRHIAFQPRTFHPKASLFTDGYEFVGPCLGTRGEVWQAPDDRDVMLITLGSVNNLHVEFYQECFEAFGGTGWHVVMPVGKRFDIAALGPVPSNFEVLPTVPQLEVLRQAKVFVSHAGLGGVLEAVSAGVPQIALPRTAEQRANAARIAELGIGVCDPADLAAAVGHIAGDSAMRGAIEELRLEIIASGGAIRAADVIEECLSG